MAHRVVIVGGGFGGLSVAHALRRSSCEVVLIDRRNFHLFQPLLYQVATGGLSPANIAKPLRTILKRQKNTRVVMAEVVAVDVTGRRVMLADGQIEYDTLVLAAGARHHYFGNAGFEAHAPGLKSIEDATKIRQRVITAFEAAERSDDAQAIQQWMTFVVVGAGPTGVELAGAVAELAQHTLPQEFRRVRTNEAKIILVEGGPRVLQMFPEKLSQRAEQSLERLGVDVRKKTLVEHVAADHVLIRAGEASEKIKTKTVLWAAGVQAAPLGTIVAKAANAETDRAGRLVVEADCSLPGFDDVFVIGDLAHFEHGDAGLLPGVAPVAIQQGRYVADLIRARQRGRDVGPFRYRDKGQMATIGRASAVFDAFGMHVGGFFAWIMWLFLHLILLVGFENRLLVLMQWFWNFVTRGRSARLITHRDAVLVENVRTQSEKSAEPVDSEA